MYKIDVYLTRERSRGKVKENDQFWDLYWDNFDYPKLSQVSSDPSHCLVSKCIEIIAWTPPPPTSFALIAGEGLKGTRENAG